MSDTVTRPYRLHVAVDRGTGPVYVLLHGINSTGHDWDTMVTAMGFDRRCIAVDELGYGESPHPVDIDYTLDDHVAALHHTLHAIHIDEPFTLVGYSMGGPIAVRYAAVHPEDVGRLVLVSAPFYLDLEEMGETGYAKAVFQTDASQAVLGLIRSAGFAESGVFKTLSAKDKHVIQDFINARDLGTDWQILQKNMRNAIQHTSFVEDLARVEAPVTFMVGEHDSFIVRSQISTLREKYCPNMEIRFLADLKADHMLLENIPTEIATQLVRNEDRRLAVALDRGEGELFVMLHGVENDGSFWNGVGLAMATRDRVVALDLLGFGQSPRPLDIAYGADEQVSAIHATLDSLLRDKETPFTLVGHSLGAIVAARFAQRFPERVKRLVLFSPPVSLSDVAVGPAHADQARASFVDGFGSLRRRGMRLASSGAVQGVLGTERLAKFEPTARSLRNAIEVEDLAGDLAATPGIPVTVVYGARDPFVVPAYAESLASVRPGIEVVKVDAGHDIATEQPLQAVELVDPLVDAERAATLVEKAKTDPKLRPRQSAWSRLLKDDMPLVIFRGLLYLGLGLGLLFMPAERDVALLRFAFAIFVFARSVSTLTGLFTTRSIREEKLASAASGLVGIAIGVFLMLGAEFGQTVLVIVAAAYLLLSGATDLYAGIRTSHASRRRVRLLAQGAAAVTVGVLLLAGSLLAAALAKAVIMVASIAAGVMLLTYAVVSSRLGAVFETRLEQ